MSKGEITDYSDSDTEMFSVEAVDDRGENSVESRKGFFARVMVFLQQVVFELRKTIWPTKSETVQYTFLVLIFVVVAIGIIVGFDFIVGKLLLPQ